MCGFTGLIFKKSLSEKRIQDFLAASDLISHRGPDYRGIYRDDNILLVHYRLKIIDLNERANQPFISSSGRSICVYNGEVYNYRELAETYSLGLRTSSDTEVLVETFEQYGNDALQEFNGIFASVIYDRKESKVSIIRDRLGVKPLYMYEDEYVIGFSSESKVFLHWLDTFSLNYNTLKEYMWLGNPAGIDTLISGISKVEPASITTINFSKGFSREKSFFWKMDLGKRNFEYNERKASVQVRKLMSSAVKRQLISDAPLGVLLSGGLDSSILVASASEYSNSIDTYTAFYDIKGNNTEELRNAKKISRQFGTNYHEIEISSQMVADDLENLIIQFDEPFADPANIPLSKLANAISKTKRVMLQGDGGDELFGGYKRYNIIAQKRFWKLATSMYSIIPDREWRHRLERTNSILKRPNDAEVMALYISNLDPKFDPFRAINLKSRDTTSEWDWMRNYRELNAELNGMDFVQKFLYTDIQLLLPNTYLEKVDKSTMLHSVESRVPFLDNDVLDFALSLDSGLKVAKGKKKYILKKAYEGILPDDILSGRKRGFDVPFNEWIIEDMYDFVRAKFEKLDDVLFDRKYCLHILSEHRMRRRMNGYLIWRILILSIWVDYYKRLGKISFET